LTKAPPTRHRGRFTLAALRDVIVPNAVRAILAGSMMVVTLSLGDSI